MNYWQRCGHIILLGMLLAQQPGFSSAEPFILPDCGGVRGIGVVVYSRTDGPMVESTTELSETCWDDETSSFQATEQSQNLELVSRQSDTLKYQRLDGGTVSALNEQLETGPWEALSEGTFNYLRWTTESSRNRDQLNGYDFVTTEGFLVGDEGFTARPDSATYDVEMVLTGVSGPLQSMAYNLFLPVQGTVTLDGEAFDIALTDFTKGMFVGDVKFDIGLTETDVGFDGTGSVVMENEMLAGAPGEMWKHLDLRLEEILPVYSGDEIAFVATLVGDMETFGGSRSTVHFSFIGSGASQ